ncbi:MAG: hypothetical protein IJ608_04280 [Lachnospiraceae bacterium]|nr:hypothetical protein [Lachnospiraceae bacterium]
MSRRNLDELKEALERNKAREKALRLEIARQKKAADIRERKERNKKIFHTADILIELMGEDILDNPERLRELLKGSLGEKDTKAIAQLGTSMDAQDDAELYIAEE